MITLILLPFQLLNFILRNLPGFVRVAIIVIRWLLGIKPKPIEGFPYVLDGDSLAFDGDIRVRLHGMDAPEMNHPEGPIAKAYLENLIQGRLVRVHIKDTDRYGRLVGIVTLEDGTDINACMVGDGFARAYASYSTDYTGLEKDAKAEGRGLWGHGGLALHPELWRKHKR